MNSKTPGQFSQDVPRVSMDSNLDERSTEFNQITQDFHGPDNKLTESRDYFKRQSLDMN